MAGCESCDSKPLANIVLFGMKHCGKSTIGAKLAERLGYTLFDLDDLMEVAYETRYGEYLSTREIFRQRGEEYFGNLEAEVAVELLNLLSTEPDPAVVAVGGRAVLNERARHVISHMGPRVYLKVNPDTLFERVEAGGLPPFLDKDDPKGSFLALFEQRRPNYESFADVTVCLDDLSPEQSVDEILNALKEYGHARQ